MTRSLRLLHDEDTISRRAGYAYWNRHHSDEIVDSLRPERPAPLIVDDQGLIWNGNTRVFILRQRGYDVDSLPRTPNPQTRIEDFDDPD